MTFLSKKWYSVWNVIILYFILSKSNVLSRLNYPHLFFLILIIRKIIIAHMINAVYQNQLQLLLSAVSPVAHQII